MNADGAAGFFGRVVDSLSYFTNVNNLLVAVVLTMLARNPHRGEFIAAYPYGFLNVVAYGLPAVLTNVAGVAALGITLGLLFWAIDWWLASRQKSNTRSPLSQSV